MDDNRRADGISELVQEYYVLLYRFAFRLTGSATDAEDLTQQTFLAAQRKLHQLREPAHAKAWLFAIVRNTFLKGLRERKAAPVISLNDVGEPAEHSAIDTELDSDAIQQALDELPEEFRTPLILFYFEEFSYRAIAEQMQVPIGTVMSRLARAKSHLRRRLTTRQHVGTEHS